MIKITVNGKPITLDSSMTIERLLASVEVPPNYLAVEVNADVVPREQHASHVVVDGDEVEVVTLVGGG